MSEEHIHEVTGRPYAYVSMGGRRVSRFMYQFEMRAQPWLCKIGLHDVYDVGEIDGSVIDGCCGSCSKLLKPRKAKPADPESAAWHAQVDDFLHCEGCTCEDKLD